MSRLNFVDISGVCRDVEVFPIGELDGTVVGVRDQLQVMSKVAQLAILGLYHNFYAIICLIASYLV